MHKPLSALPDTAAQQFMKSLRQRTAHCHEALEAHPLSQSITASTIDRESYITYLQVMQEVVTGMEHALHPVLLGTITDLPLRIKAHWLEEDLAGLHAAELPLKPFTISEPHPSIAFALGAYYVLEGSTLGGRVILKSLPPSLGLSGSAGIRYFSGYGAATGTRWQDFITGLCDYAVSNNCGEEVIAGAECAFADILEYFNYCQAHEAERHCQS